MNIVGYTCVDERFDNRLVGICQAHILAADRDINSTLAVDRLTNHLLPASKSGTSGLELKVLTDQFVQALLVEHQRHVIDRLYCTRLEYGPWRHITEQGDFLLEVRAKCLAGAADQHVGLDTDLAQCFNAVLCGLGLELSAGAEIRYQCNMDIQHVVAAQVEAELTDCFQKRQGFDITHRTADLADNHVNLALQGQAHQAGFNLVGHMGNYLHGAPR